MKCLNGILATASKGGYDAGTRNEGPMLGLAAPAAPCKHTNSESNSRSRFADSFGSQEIGT